MNLLINKTAKQGLVWLVSGLLLAIFLLTTSPLDLALPVLLIPFGLFFVWVRSGVICLAILIRRKDTVSRKVRFAATSLATVSVLTVSLQSLGQLSWRDLLLIGALGGLLLLYFSKSDLI
jgi:hypothetical protein